MTTATTHQGPHPEHGGLETHIGTRDNCSGPDCGPPDPEDEIREAVLDLEALSEAAHGDTWRIVREQEDVMDPSVGRLLADLLHEIAEDMNSGPLTPVQESARKLAHQINNRP